MLFKIIGATLIVCVVAVVLRQYKSEYAIFTVVAAAVLIYGLILGGFRQIMDFLTELSLSIENAGAYLAVMLKCFATAVITEISCDICRDSGESALATKIQLAGKIAIIIIAIPLFREVLALVTQ